jgi:hypothetical protein
MADNTVTTTTANTGAVGGGLQGDGMADAAGPDLMVGDGALNADDLARLGAAPGTGKVSTTPDWHALRAADHPPVYANVEEELQALRDRQLAEDEAKAEYQDKIKAQFEGEAAPAKKKGKAAKND